MSREYQEHIFEPFSQEREDARSTQQGIGLGMAIVKGLIEKMGGTIKVKSEEGIGSTFILRIPFKLAPAPDGYHDACNGCSPCKACKNRKCKENFVQLFGIEIRISRIRKPIFHVRTDTEKSRS